MKALERSTLRILIACAALFCSIQPVGAAGGDDEDLSAVETRLVEKLLNNYKATVSPAVRGGVKVQVGVVLTGMDISTATETMELSGWWRMFWKDHRLSWNESEWGVKSLTFKEGEIWSPDVTMYEKTSESMYSQERMAYPGGDIVMSTPRKSKFACPMSLSAFPFDVQKCHFTIGSWSHDGSRLDVLPRQIPPENYFEPTGEDLPDRSPVEVADLTNFHEWFLTAVRVVWRNNFYSCCPEPFPTIRIELEIQRATMTYVSGVVAPLIIVTCIGFGTLLMPAPTSGAKPALCVTILLTTATVYFVASSQTPNSNKTTLIGRLYIACLVTNLCLVFWSIWTTALNLVHRDHSSSVQHFMDFFHHFDSEGSGRLSREQVGIALEALGLSPSEQHKLVHHLLNEEGEITVEQWEVIGQLAHKSDRLAVYHNPVVETFVTQAIIGDFKKHGSNVGHKGGGLFHLADPAFSNEAHSPARLESAASELPGFRTPRRNSGERSEVASEECSAEAEGLAPEEGWGQPQARRGRRLSTSMAAVEEAVQEAQRRRRRSQRGAAGGREEGGQRAAARREGGTWGRGAAPEQVAVAVAEAEEGAGLGHGEALPLPHARPADAAPPLNMTRRGHAGENGKGRDGATAGGMSEEPANWLEALGVKGDHSPERAAGDSGAVEMTNPPPTKGAARRVAIRERGEEEGKEEGAGARAGSGRAVSIAELKRRGSGGRAEAEEAGGAGGELPPETPRAPPGNGSAQRRGWEAIRQEPGPFSRRAEATPQAEGEGAGGARGQAERRGLPAPEKSVARQGAGAAQRERWEEAGPAPWASWASSTATVSDRLDVRAGCVSRADLHFRRVLDKLGDRMDQFAGVNHHPTAVGRKVAAWTDSKGRLILPLAFSVYLLMEFVGVWSNVQLLGSSTGYRHPESGERLILYEYKDFRAADAGTKCYKSYFKPPTPDAVATEFALESEEACMVR